MSACESLAETRLSPVSRTRWDRSAACSLRRARVGARRVRHHGGGAGAHVPRVLAMSIPISRCVGVSRYYGPIRLLVPLGHLLPPLGASPLSKQQNVDAPLPPARQARAGLLPGAGLMRLPPSPWRTRAPISTSISASSSSSLAFRSPPGDEGAASRSPGPAAARRAAGYEPAPHLADRGVMRSRSAAARLGRPPSRSDSTRRGPGHRLAAIADSTTAARSCRGHRRPLSDLRHAEDERRGVTDRAKRTPSCPRGRAPPRPRAASHVISLRAWGRGAT